MIDCLCVGLFQTLDGQDVMLSSLEVVDIWDK